MVAGDARKISIWRQPRVLLGVIAIFLVLGFEASLFGFYRNFAEDKSIAGLTSTQSQKLFTVYFGIFALGRVVGSYVQKKIRPVVTLVFSLLAAILLLALLLLSNGSVAIAAYTAIGFFGSIFFPTLFAIAIEGLTVQAGDASGLLTMGFLGGAILPVIQGRLADVSGLKISFALGFIVYLFVLFYLWKIARHRNAGRYDNIIRQ